MDAPATEAAIPTYEGLCCGSKAYRTMSCPSYGHPQPAPNKQAPRNRPKKGAPLDPEDLTRRLRAHIAQETAITQQRRAARLSMANGVYHHIPQVAALSFETTTTQEKLRQAHRLSEPLTKNLRYGESDDGVGSGHAYRKPATTLPNAQGDRASAESARNRNRNSYHWSAALDRVAEMNVERDVYRCPRRTSIFGAPGAHKSRATQRPISTGDFLTWQEKEEPTEPKEVKRDMNDRHDWTQRDERDEREEARRSMKEKIAPLMSLKLRKAKIDDGAGEEFKPKSPAWSPLRASFFGKFKRVSSSDS
ncbi:hypothetical protein DSL72_002966 [Monilinia vaccinii-corymbosi]|uniref:Uncharacterized protein n=1 Tax=Monilinia vaccinii-corymbosi TaxID=61207 RepID=A0A8A3PE25_9HELO|nr:hypothetical protein DSL72_002966 [Monilinia vaccinii-corymbosi]